MKTGNMTPAKKTAVGWTLSGLQLLFQGRKMTNGDFRKSVTSCPTPNA